MARKKAAGSCEKAIREYFGGVLDGMITACAKMQQVAAIVLRDLDNDDPLYPYHYREEYAQKHVSFIERSASRSSLSFFSEPSYPSFSASWTLRENGSIAKCSGLWGARTARPRLLPP